MLINVARRPANAAHLLTLSPGDTCPRYGTLVVTPPSGFQSGPLAVDLPICDATVRSVD